MKYMYYCSQEYRADYQSLVLLKGLTISGLNLKNVHTLKVMLTFITVGCEKTCLWPVAAQSRSITIELTDFGLG